MDQQVDPADDDLSPSLMAIVAEVDIADLPCRGQTSPDGSMTVAFTDLEGSTEMLERLGEREWLEVMRDHNRLVRDRVSAHDGAIVKSQGDGFMLIFASASAALACATELQRLFDVYSSQHAEQELRVRIGLHTGNVFKEQDDFLGRTVIVAARIADRARGGEVLVSDAVKEYTERAGRWEFGSPSNLGLKGLSSDQRVYSVAWHSRHN